MGNLINPGMYTSATEEWETPEEFFKALDARFRFTLDACATKKNHKCDKYYTKEEDGLAQDWGGERVWINPPYGREISKWIQKAEEEARKVNTICVMLLPARTDTAWFHDHVLPEADVYFIRGRIRFSGNKSNAPFPSMIAVFDGRPRLTGWEGHMEVKIQGDPEEIRQKIKKALGENELSKY